MKKTLLFIVSAFFIASPALAFELSPQYTGGVQIVPDGLTSVATGQDLLDNSGNGSQLFVFNATTGAWMYNAMIIDDTSEILVDITDWESGIDYYVVGVYPAAGILGCGYDFWECIASEGYNSSIGYQRLYYGSEPEQE